MGVYGSCDVNLVEGLSSHGTPFGSSNGFPLSSHMSPLHVSECNLHFALQCMDSPTHPPVLRFCTQNDMSCSIVQVVSLRTACRRTIELPMRSLALIALRYLCTPSTSFFLCSFNSVALKGISLVQMVVMRNRQSS